MPSMLRSLERSALFQVEYQPERCITIQVISMQPFTPNEPQPLIQLQARSIRHLGLQYYFIGVARGHGINGQSDELRGYASAAVFFLCCEHGDVAAVGAAAVWFELACDYAD